jgi:cellulose 1,4-beta-cellobiosidase
MKATLICLVALTATSVASPLSCSVRPRFRRGNKGCGSNVVLDARTNVWTNYTLHPNIFYRQKVETAAKAISEPELQKRALRVADIGTFIWL